MTILHFRNRAEQPNFSAVHCTLAMLFAVVSLAIVSGCRTLGNEEIVRPAKHSLRADDLLVLSNVRLKKSHPIIQDLLKLRQDVMHTLNLNEQNREVVVYIFDGEEEFRRYFAGVYPDLPHRRAYFIGSRSELAVYTYWGSNIQEDLRHEYTHGILHSALTHVPLWLDEGLAEYFEVNGPQNGRIHAQHSHRLKEALSQQWKPDLKRLEKIREFAQMNHQDYRESWAWVHFLLHHSDDSREILLSYLEELKSKTSISPISQRVAQTLPVYEERFLSHVTTLNLATNPLSTAGFQRTRSH